MSRADAVAARAKSTYVALTSSSGFDMDMNQATRRPDTGGGRVVVVVGGTKGLMRAHSCCCLFLIVRTFTRASLAQRVAFVVMLCQFRIDELEAAARGISRRSHRMAARRRRMGPMAALRVVCASLAVQTLLLAPVPGFARRMNGRASA